MRATMLAAVLTGLFIAGAALGASPASPTGPLANKIADPLGAVGIKQKPMTAPLKPVTETLWGQKVTDNYRYMEALDPSTLAWMKTEGAYTRKVLDAIGPRSSLEQKIAAFTASFGFVQGYVAFGGRSFYEERAPGSDNFDLMVKDAKGERKIVDVAALRAANGGKPYAINYFLASLDGSKVAAGISQGGSEEASLWVYDAATGARIAGPIDRAQFGATAWTEDSKTLYFIRLKQLAKNEPAVDKYKDATLDAWDLKGEPQPILGSSVGHPPPFKPDETPALGIAPGSPMAAALNINGVQNEMVMYLAPLAALADPKVQWAPFVARADDVNSFDMRGQEIFLLSHKNAPTFQVLRVSAGAPLSSAQVLVPADPRRVIDSIHAASDALYVLEREGAYSHLLRVAADGNSAEEIPLPFKGHVGEAFTDPRVAGIVISLESFVVPPTIFGYEPGAKSFTDLKLGVKPAFDSSRYQVSDLEARAHDGTMVPLSLVQPKGTKGAAVTLIQAYGSYGISQLADFSPRSVSFLEAGGTYASCHVRGGGELGEAWRLGGKDANKPNTWRDLIACGEELIRRGVTTRDRLFIFGGSAGGITMGRALTERPDLFAGVIDSVPAANTLRAEFSPNGPPNIPEFGSVKDRQGFKNLYAMDTLQHVKKGAQYPAVLITTGLNDPRVSPWEPAKLAAALQASGTAKPVLLRIEEEAGHGIGSTKTQNDKLYADMYAFVFWRAGKPGWRPAVK
jgi:prolyl oligopeptidase